MNALLLLTRSIAAGLLAFVATAPAQAAQVASCSLLSLGQASAIIGFPVTVNGAGSFAPTAREGLTISNCSYLEKAGVAGSRVARLTLMWGPSPKLAQVHEYYVRRHKESSALKGGVLVFASVAAPTPAGLNYNARAGDKLLAAALQRL